MIASYSSVRRRRRTFSLPLTVIDILLPTTTNTPKATHSIITNIPPSIKDTAMTVLVLLVQTQRGTQWTKTSNSHHFGADLPNNIVSQSIVGCPDEIPSIPELNVQSHTTSLANDDNYRNWIELNRIKSRVCAPSNRDANPRNPLNASGVLRDKLMETRTGNACTPFIVCGCHFNRTPGLFNLVVVGVGWMGGWWWQETERKLIIIEIVITLLIIRIHTPKLFQYCHPRTIIKYSSQCRPIWWLSMLASVWGKGFTNLLPD